MAFDRRLPKSILYNTHSSILLKSKQKHDSKATKTGNNNKET
jgi:hypothetical protein